MKMADPPAAAVKSNKRKAAEGVAKVIAAAGGTQTSKAWSSINEKCFESEEEPCTDKYVTATPVKEQVDKSSRLVSCVLTLVTPDLPCVWLHTQLYLYIRKSAISQCYVVGCCNSLVVPKTACAFLAGCN